MKRYKIHGSLVAVIFMLIWCSILAGMISFMAIVPRQMGGHLSIFTFIIPSIMMMAGLSFLTYNLVGCIRRRNVLSKGCDSTGIVKNIHYYTGKNNVSYYIEFEYRTQSGEKAICSINVSPLDAQYFVNERRIPIKVFKNLAYPDFKKLKESDSAQYEPYKDEYGYDANSNNLYCPKCGSMHKEEDIYCPHCGNKL